MYVTNFLIDNTKCRPIKYASLSSWCICKPIAIAFLGSINDYACSSLCDLAVVRSLHNPVMREKAYFCFLKYLLLLSVSMLSYFLIWIKDHFRIFPVKFCFPIVCVPMVSPRLRGKIIQIGWLINWLIVSLWLGTSVAMLPRTTCCDLTLMSC